MRDESVTKRPTWFFRCRGALTVWRDGEEIGPPPAQSAIWLVAALLAAPEDWHSRRYLASLLFPGPNQGVAFRQCLSRTRRWLGEGAIELRPGQLRLSEDVRHDLAEGTSGGLILPDQSHPACQLLRDRWSPSAALTTEGRSARIRDLLWSLADLSPGDARVLLVGSPTLRHELHVEEVRRLGDALRPTDRREPGARALLELLGWTCHVSGAVVESLSFYRKFTRLARHERDVNGVAAGQAFEIFSLIECGQIALAWERYRSWVDPERAPGSRLLMRNAEVALLWNSGRMKEAAVALKEAESLIQAAPAWDRLHFWSNAAVFCAEHGEVERAIDFVAKVSGQEQTHDNRYVQMVLGLAKATWLAEEDPERAVRMLEEGERASDTTGWKLAVIYQREVRALALRRLGDLGEAARVWNTAERLRKGLGMRLTPRLLARRAQIFGTDQT
jgi:tetratricopeptide (TPR) repeat protein